MTDELPPQFYRGVQNYQYHSGVGLESIRDTNVEANAPESQYKSFSDGNAIYSYSFGLNPEDFQPSGSINFSNIEQAQLKYRTFQAFRC